MEFKGKGNHSVHELERICIHQDECLHQKQLINQDLLKALTSCVMSMKVHPDNEPDSEFEGFVNNGIDAINNATKKGL
jgi:hypothetical protein